MSIEKALADLTAAVNRNSDLVEAHTAALHKLGGASSAKTTTTAKADTSKTEDDAAAAKAAKAEKAAKAKAEKEKAAAAAAAEKGDEITVEEMAERVTEYLKTGSKEQRAENKANVGKLLEHYGAARWTAIDAENRAEALGFLEDFAEGRTPEIFAEENDDEDDGDDDVV